MSIELDEYVGAKPKFVKDTPEKEEAVENAETDNQNDSAVQLGQHEFPDEKHAGTVPSRQRAEDEEAD